MNHGGKIMAVTVSEDKSYLSLKAGVQTQSANELQTILADSIFMYLLYKKYHWHVRGEDFYQYHLLFDKHADELLPLIDLIAERLRTLGSLAPGMPQNVIDYSSLQEGDIKTFKPKELVSNLLDVHEQFLVNVRRTIELSNKNKDEATSDILVSDVLRLHELQVWFLRSSI